MKQPNWCHLREKLIQGESLEMPVKAVFKATEPSIVADNSDSRGGMIPSKIAKEANIRKWTHIFSVSSFTLRKKRGFGGAKGDN